MLDQYHRIKARHRDAILFFRLGDFYEMFNEDALEASAILDLTLTKRQNQPMCGIPYHAAKAYIARLLKAGKKIAICEQRANEGRRGLMDREVIEIITPGTAVEDDYLEQGSNNFLADICFMNQALCFSYLDVSTGEFKAYSISEQKEVTPEILRAELYRISPRELLVQQSILENNSLYHAIRESKAMIEPQPDWTYNQAHAVDFLKKRFGIVSLKGFGFDEQDPAVAVAANLLEYVQEMIHRDPPHIRTLQHYRPLEYVLLDEATKRNLELVRNLNDSSRRDTLIDVIDKTRTAGGARMLQQWLFQPLTTKQGIEERLEAVSFLYHEQVLLNDVRKILSGVLDTERLISRLAVDKAHAKDLCALRSSIEAGLVLFAKIAEASPPPALKPEISVAQIEECRSVIDIVNTAILDEPSILLTEGNLIRDGYNSELDDLRSIHKNSKKVLEEYLDEERQRSGIQNLRIRYNRVIGYYLEVTKGNLSSVPEHFIRRQSLVGGERYTTVRLEEIESKINGAQEKIIEIERKLFLEVREKLAKFIPALMECSRSVSRMDCIASLAQAATELGYTKPEISEELEIDISNGRHPVVEQCLPYGDFVPNSLSFSKKDEWFVLITGPNMAGKSTVLRQTALIVLLAHIGSFVPADSARIGLVDKIFCRVGAQDNLARGESTFLVEMHETAFILNTATEKSLVIMDEVGRGTGTMDGLSIAWAVSEFLIQKIGCRTLFATHYHELTSMQIPGLRTMMMTVLEHDGTISFPKRLEQGVSSGSYGIHVAKLAGVPREVTSRASALASQVNELERDLAGKKSTEKSYLDEPHPANSFSRPIVPPQELFSDEEMVIASLKSLDPNALTPLEALQILSKLIETLKRDSHSLAHKI